LLFPAFTGSYLDEFALKLRKSSQYREHQSTTGSGGVTPWIGQGFKKTSLVGN
jgi:hypothetical protein